ncbi:MAG TPA: winged helix-turn-helix domain-containing protein [Cellvibrio sp.]|nr:winged helix-turn-helix domain-containing protein [Cellvibrio sp.]
MKYLFNDFMFDGEQRMLYKNNEAISCRHNEAKLLALFLSDPQRIFSKDDILEQVWNGKVVSEQAVFQNISVLRALIGEDAIKTFPKKGYQWQLAVKPFVDDVVNPIPSVTYPEKSGVGFGGRIPVFAMVVLVALGVIGAFSFHSSNTSSLPRVALLPLLAEPASGKNEHGNKALVQSVWESLQQSESYFPVAMDSLTDYRDFFYAPQKYVSSIQQQTNSDVAMVAVTGMRGNEVTIRYLLKSKTGRWSASHTAANVPLLVDALNKHIELILDSGILMVDEFDSNLINARLKILHQQAQDDLVILAALANSEIRQGNPGNALVLVDVLIATAKSQRDTNSEGNGYVIAAQAYIAQSLYAEAAAALHNASELLTAQQDYFSLALVQQAYASLAFAKQDYASFKQSLIAGIAFAQQAQEPLMEVGFATYLSIVANKFGNKEDRQAYLDHAESVLDQTGQSREHYGSIYFYSGMYADNDASAEKLYRKVLAILPLDQRWWERDRAREHLTQLLINQSRWDEALNLYSADKLDISEELMVSKIYAARQDWQQAEVHGLSAFRMANLSGQKHYAMDASLALLNVYAAANQVEKMPLYKQFIIKEAENFSYWIKMNQVNLDKFAISIHQ